MKIGLLKELKPGELRVLLTPEAVGALVQDGHDLFVESSAGKRSNFFDEEYERFGAQILPTAEKVFSNSQLILKVQAPMSVEYELFSSDHICFSFLLLPNQSDRLNSLVNTGAIFFATEMIQLSNGDRPILKAMSEIAAKMAVVEAAKYLESPSGGKGILLSGSSSVEPARVTIIGGGTAGKTAALHAAGCGAHVTLFDEDFDKLIKFKEQNPHVKNLRIFAFNTENLDKILPQTDVLISAVFRPGYKAPMLVSEQQVKLMEPGSVIIDLSVDNGGSVETSRPTTQDNPVFKIHDIIHYCVTNVPAGVPHTSSQALSKAILPYIKQLADLGFSEAVATVPQLRECLNIYRGKVVDKILAETNGYEYYDILELLELNL